MSDLVHERVARVRVEEHQRAVAPDEEDRAGSPPEATQTMPSASTATALGRSPTANESSTVLSDLWCRSSMLPNVETIENMKHAGVDLLGDHRDDFPPEYFRWVDEGYRMTLPELARDQQIKTEIYDAIQGVFADYDLLVTPTLAEVAVENSDDGNTVGPRQINGVEVDALIGWCMTYFTNFSGHPSASISAGLAEGNLPVGMQIIGKRYADADVLTASAVFEQLRPWSDTYALIQS